MIAIVALAAPLFVAVPATAVPGCSLDADGFCYVVDSPVAGQATIVDYAGAATDITVPSVAGGQPVTTIGASAFEYNSLTSVVIPDSVTYISAWAFLSNPISSLTLGNHVEYIGFYAFRGNEPTTVGTTIFRAQDPLVTFHVGATYTPGAAGFWNAGGSAYRVQEIATATFVSPVGTSPSSVDVVVGDALANPGALGEVGWAFNGWFDAASGGTAVTFPLTITADTALHAQWEDRTVTSPAHASTGETVTVTGTGFEPGESVDIELHSTAVLLATVTASAGGTITANVTIPTDATPGAHTIVLTGTVTGTTSEDITIDAVLAATGTDAAGMAMTAFALLALGGVLLGTRRRRA